MDDTISRQAAINTVLNIRQKCDTNDIDDYRDILVECFEELPTAEKRGKWIPQDHNYKHGNVSTCLYFAPVCSECGNTGDFKMNYCPNCGARMGE